jgi:hypothetical protein
VYAPTPSMPALAAAVSTVRRMLRGSTGVPSSVVNTRPEFCHWLAARSCSAALLFAARSQHRHQRCAERQRAPRPVRLGFGHHQLAADAPEGAPHGQQAGGAAEQVERDELAARTVPHAGQCCTGPVDTPWPQFGGPAGQQPVQQPGQIRGCSTVRRCTQNGLTCKNRTPTHMCEHQ